MKQKLKETIDKKIRRRDEPERLGDEPVPRITNKTVSDDREEVLSGARKLIYPLQHPKRYIVMFSTILFVLAIVGFFTYSTLALYRYQTTSNFMYRVTQVLPFPVARSGSMFIAYENYLFELRHYIHYYENQQGIDFDTDVGAQQLDEFRRRALEKVINDAYIRKIAEEEGINVSFQEIEEQIALVRRQDRLGNSNEMLEGVLRDFFDWSIDDFRRNLEQQLLAQKVVAAFDDETRERADEAFTALQDGADFAEVASEYSQDPATVEQGGEFGFDITRTSRDIAPKTVDVLFSLEEGEISEVINIGYASQIVRLLERDGDNVRAAHILLPFEDIDTYVNEAKESEPARAYITLPEPDDDVEPLIEEEQSLDPAN